MVRLSNRWRIIDCSSLKGKIQTARGAVKILKDDHPPSSVPTADVAVVLIGMSATFSVAALHRLLSEDIAVLFCDWKGVPEGAAFSWSSHGRVGARHRAQSCLSIPRQKNAWGRIIRAKVEGQAAVLREYNRVDTTELRSLAREVRSGDPGNIEARAARLYWQALWGEESFRRHPGLGSGESCRNSHLDYAYTVLRGHGIRAVLGAGLSPTIGLFHHGRSNNFALVDDIIEPFRPAIDSSVSRLAPNADMKDPEVRKHLVAAADQRFLPDGRRISAALDELAQHFGQYIEGELNTLPVPSWTGPIRSW